MKKLTNEEFIARSVAVHGNKYDYSKSAYNGMDNKIIVTCPIHGDFETTPSRHINKKCGCKLCSGMVKWTKELLIERGTNKYGNRFDYSLSEPSGKDNKVLIKCNVCGTIFEQSPHNHIGGACGGCPTCRYGYVAEAESIKFDEFVNRSRSVHGDKYKYHEETYRGIRFDTLVTCPIHGDFWQNATTHSSGCGCNKCANESMAKAMMLNTDTFIKRARDIHGDEYDYSKSEYIDWKTDVVVTCKRHGDFKINPYSHWCGRGCPICKSSSGERIVGSFLVKNNIKFLKEYAINNTSDLCDNHHLYIDYFLPEYNIAIEYNGAQHYMPVDFWGGEESFKKQKRRDLALIECCKGLGCKLVIIPYTETKRIAEILEREIKIQK